MSHPLSPIKTVQVLRYVLPMREGGSMPGLVEADDGNQYVIKFRGAAQGPKVLIAELIGGEIARALGLNVPEIIFANLDEAFGRLEPDEEIQSQLKASVGMNIGLRFLDGAITFDPIVNNIDPCTASRIVWLDSLITNIDRSARNTNMLIWNKQLWLIDHGAALYFHYRWSNKPEEQAMKPFINIKDHVLLKNASLMDDADEVCRGLLNHNIIMEIVANIPDDWLMADNPFDSIEEHRYAYSRFLLTRIASSAIFVNEIEHARKQII